MKKLSKEKRDKLVLTLIMGVAGMVAIYYLLIGAQRKKIEDLDLQIAAETASLQKAERAVKMEEDYRKDLELSEAQLKAEQATMAPPENRYFWFVNLVKDFRERHLREPNAGLRSPATLSRIDITQTSPETVVDLPAIPKFPYKASVFKVAGTALYDGLGDFLADFENGNPHARVQNIEISPANLPGAQGVETNKLAFTMDVMVLFRDK